MNMHIRHEASENWDLKDFHRWLTQPVCFSVGIDSEGHAANYVETEQIVQHNGAKASFVQVS